MKTPYDPAYDTALKQVHYLKRQLQHIEAFAQKHGGNGMAQVAKMANDAIFERSP